MNHDIEGYEEVVRWFGGWPSFHDAEIVSIHLEREGLSAVRLHTWNVSTRTDAEGRFVRDREAIVVIEFSDIHWVRVEGEDANRQNVIRGLMLHDAANGHRLVLSPSYGLAGEVIARQMRMRIEPGPVCQ